MTKITRFCKLTEGHNGPNSFDISRPNIFGNPYTHIKNRQTKAQVVVKTRDEAIALYDKYFDNMLKDDSEVGQRFREEWDKMYNAYKTYDEIFLGCFCHLDETCHADIIKKKLIQRSMKEKLAHLRNSKSVKSLGKERIGA